MNNIATILFPRIMLYSKILTVLLMSPLKSLRRMKFVVECWMNTNRLSHLTCCAQDTYLSQRSKHWFVAASYALNLLILEHSMPNLLQQHGASFLRYEKVAFEVQSISVVVIYFPHKHDAFVLVVL